MKLKVNFGDELKHAEIKYPTIVPVKINGEVVGEAVINTDGMAEINIINEQRLSDFQNILMLGVGGVVTSREGDLITGFSLKEASIQHI